MDEVSLSTVFVKTTGQRADGCVCRRSGGRMDGTETSLLLFPVRYYRNQLQPHQVEFISCPQTVLRELKSEKLPPPTPPSAPSERKGVLNCDDISRFGKRCGLGLVSAE